MKTQIGTIALSLALACASSQAQSAGAFAGQVPVNASLKKDLSSRNAKAGQEISATLEKSTTIGNITLPKGTFLLGHIVDVTKHSKETPNGSLTVVFDHAQAKKTEPFVIHASLYKISLSENQILGQRLDVDSGMRGTAQESNTTSALRESTDLEGRSVVGSESRTGAPVHVISMVPGVSLSAVASDTKSGILTAKNHDVELGAGLELVVGIALK